MVKGNLKSGCFGLLMVIAAGCTKSAVTAQAPGDDPSTRTTTDFNAPSTPEEMAQKCDVPIYPGALAPDDMSRMPHKDNDGNTVYELVLTSKSTPAQVAEFYSKSLKLPSSKGKDGTTMFGTSPHGNELLLEIVHEGGQTVTRIHSIVHKS
jgi:hypothetical protein